MQVKNKEQAELISRIIQVASHLPIVPTDIPQQVTVFTISLWCVSSWHFGDIFAS